LVGFDLALVLALGGLAAIPGCVAGRRRVVLRGMLGIASAVVVLYVVARLLPHGGSLWRLWPCAVLGACAMCGLSIPLDRGEAALIEK